MVYFKDIKRQAFANLANIHHIHTSVVKVGFPEGGMLAPASRRSESGDGPKGIREMAGIAAVHEYGSPKRHIPERSFIRTAVDENTGELAALKQAVLLKIMDGSVNVETGLGILGQFMQDKIKGKISTILTPPLHPATIKAKKSSKPLIDTGQMRATVQWKIAPAKGRGILSKVLNLFRKR